jgi:murein DD-endopeptidase MepM/ murein hydrolase activator NlpD
VREFRGPQGKGATFPEPVATLTPPIENGATPRTHALATLAWLEEQIADAGDAVTLLAVLAEERAQETRSVPTLWPVRGAVSSPFGWRHSPYGGGWEWHAGIDITAAYGTPIHATADGEVVSAGPARGYGVLVVLDHGAATTRYAHLSATWVRAGQRVLRGEPLGALGGTGRATAPHLHYEVWLGNDALDPACFLGHSAGTTLVRSERRPSCARVQARLEDQRSPFTARDAGHVATAPAGVGG